MNRARRAFQWLWEWRRAIFSHPVRRHEVVLYTRRDCHLCDDAKAVLERHFPAVAIASVDIDSDPELRQRFDEMVPVVQIDGQVRFKGRVNEVLLRRLLAADGE